MLFANSSFTTLVVTFIYATYFTKGMAGDELTGTALWSRAITVTALVVALLSPYLGAVADRGGYRKRLLFLVTFICVAGTVLLIGSYVVRLGIMTSAPWLTIATWLTSFV